MPPAPAFLFQPPASFWPFRWVEETGDEQYRRALYTFHRRSTPYPALQVFDQPNGLASCARRWRSNSPLQALTALNEPIFVECARLLARKTIEEGGKTDSERLRYAFRRAVAKMPSDAELAELNALLVTQQIRIDCGELNPNAIVGALPANASPELTPSRWASYTIVARVLLNLDETITKE